MKRSYLTSRRTFSRALLSTPALLVPSSAFAAGSYTGFDSDFADATSSKPYKASYLACGICDVVYGEHDYRARIWNRLGVSEVAHKRDTSQDADACIIRTDANLILAVRGSGQIVDWLQDTRIKSDYAWSQDDIKVHQGFGKQAHALYGWARDEIADKRGSRKLWVVGHSLGGSVANLLAYRLKRDEGVSIDGVITYGGARCSGSNWKDHYQELLGSVSRRWANQHDPIPHAPQGKQWKGVGQKSVIRNGDKINFDANSLPDADWIPGHIMGYHACGKYLVSLWRGMGGSRHGDMPDPDRVSP